MSTPIVVVGVTGLPGKTGPEGPQGQPGIPGDGSATFIYDQAVPSASWTITHNQDKFPSVAVVDTAGTVFWPDVNYINSNQIVVNFGAAFSGKAYLN